MGKQDRGEIWRRRAFRFSVLLCAVTLCLTAGLAIAYKTQAGRHADKMRNAAKDEAGKIAVNVTEYLNQIKPKVAELADDLSSGRLAGESLEKRLREVYEQYRDAWSLLEVGVAYEPAHNPLAPGQEYAPHFGLTRGEAQAFDVRAAYSYREKKWFQKTKEDGAHWIEPYFGDATKRWTAGYAAPFYQAPGSRIFAGVVRINFDLDKIRGLVTEEAARSLDDDMVPRTGYVFLLSAQNKIVTHPIKSYTGKDISALRETDGTLQAITGRLKGKAGGAGDDIVDPITGESYWIFAEDVSSTQWKSVVVFNKRETRDPAKTIRIYQRLISATVVVFLCCVSFLVLRAYSGSEGSLWGFSIASSLILFAGTATIWILAVTGESHGGHSGVYIVDAATAEATVLRHLALSKPDAGDVIRIPIGVFVQSMTFTSANNVHLTGYIWQRKIKTPDDIDGEDLLGFILPEAEQVDRNQVYENDEVIGWYFETILRQQFDYSRYPFDREDVWIRLWPKSMNPNVVLIPDFASYLEKKIEGIPGVEKDFVLEGWTVKNSYFNFRTNSYNVDFGQQGFNSERSLELYFSVGLRRNVVSAFVSDMIPIMVIAFLAFAVLMSSTRHEEKIGLFGFSTSAVLAYCAALFFVLIVGHVHLRNTLATQSIIYMEYFYFAMYLVILTVSTDSLLFASSKSFAFIHYKDNMIVKQLYWPLLAGLLFVITLLVFH